MWSRWTGVRKAMSNAVKMPNRVTAPAESSMTVKKCCKPLVLSTWYVMNRRSPRHDFVSCRRTERGKFFKSLAHSPASPVPELPLASVCKLTYGTRPRDARSLASLALSPRTGEEKLYHSSPVLFI
ncbi:MAG: hypothetical protein [Anelloviridae sp.]|nr:MAG: hypothetical protein [Anelloviridae sp.]